MIGLGAIVPGGTTLTLVTGRSAVPKASGTDPPAAVRRRPAALAARPAGRDGPELRPRLAADLQAA